jgi:hypothetical protein
MAFRKLLELLVPHRRRGGHDGNTCRVIRGIVHVPRSGAHWSDCPRKESGPDATAGKRFKAPEPTRYRLAMSISMGWLFRGCPSWMSIEPGAQSQGLLFDKGWSR